MTKKSIQWNYFQKQRKLYIFHNSIIFFSIDFYFPKHQRLFGDKTSPSVPLRIYFWFRSFQNASYLVEQVTSKFFPESKRAGTRAPGSTSTATSEGGGVTAEQACADTAELGAADPPPQGPGDGVRGTGRMLPKAWGEAGSVPARAHEGTPTHDPSDLAVPSGHFPHGDCLPNSIQNRDLATFCKHARALSVWRGPAGHVRSKRTARSPRGPGPSPG